MIRFPKSFVRISRQLLLSIPLLFAACLPELNTSPPSQHPGDFPICLSNGTSEFKINKEHPLYLEGRKRLKKANPSRSLYTPGRRRSEKKPIEAYFSKSCIEYHDSIDFLKAKLQLFASLNLVSQEEQTFNPETPLWSQVTAEGYQRIVLFFHRLESALANTEQDKLPAYSYPSVCEMRLIFSKFIQSKDFEISKFDFEHYLAHRTAYLQEASQTGLCQSNDLESIYVFRGDATLNPLTPESTVMRAAEKLAHLQCDSEEGALSSRCSLYREQPYTQRLFAAKAVLHRLLSPSILRSAVFADSDEHFLLVSDKDNDALPEALAFNKNNKEGLELHKELQRLMAWQMIAKKPERFLNRHLELIDRISRLLASEDSSVRLFLSGSKERSLNVSESDVGALLSRHSDFYGIHFLSFKPQLLSMFYSPWLSGTPFINEAHKFSFRGYAMSGRKGRKMHWMWVFRIQNKNLLNARTAKSGESGEKSFSVDEIASKWIDERRYLSKELAQDENSFVRLSLPQPEEFDSLLWLGNIDTPDSLLSIVKAKE